MSCKLSSLFFNVCLTVKPQQSTTGSKKAAPISSGPIKPRAMMPPMMTSKSPVDGPLKPGKDDQEIQVCCYEVHSIRGIQ